MTTDNTPMSVTGSIEDLQNLKTALEISIRYAVSLKAEMFAASLVRWQMEVQQAIKDEQFEKERTN